MKQSTKPTRRPTPGEQSRMSAQDALMWARTIWQDAAHVGRAPERQKSVPHEKPCQVGFIAEWNGCFCPVGQGDTWEEAMAGARQVLQLQDKKSRRRR